jgi:phosphatidylinositol alpha-mannosyltransferase
MSAGAPVVASNLPAFVRVLDGGQAGATFANEDSADLARQLLRLLADPRERERLGEAGHRRAWVFDWSVVAEDVMAVYDTVTHGSEDARSDPAADTRWTRLLRGRRGGGD